MTDNGNGNGNGKRPSGLPGVTWVASSRHWSAALTRPGTTKSFYFGQFPEDQLDLAREVILRARETPVEAWPGIKAEFRARRDALIIERGGEMPRRGGGRKQPQEQVSDLRRQGAGSRSEIGEAIRAAIAADDQLARLQQQAQDGLHRAQAAEEEAVAAWNRVAEALVRLGTRPDTGFHESKLGILAERLETEAIEAGERI